MALCLIALGANIGDRRGTLEQAIAQLSARPEFSLRARSVWRETKPIGGPASQDRYLNGAVLIETTQSPEAVLHALATIENALGRRRAEHWGPRTLDLDLLLYDQVVLNTPRLELPHPRMAFRRFVIEPAAEIAPHMTHPVIGWTMRQLCEHLRFAIPYVAVTGVAARQNALLAAELARHTGARLISQPGICDEVASSSAGRTVEAEIELAARRELLSVRRWPAGQRLVISDFWIEQDLGIKQGFEIEQTREVARAHGHSSAVSNVSRVTENVTSVVPPKLLVLLTPRTAESAMLPGTSNTAGEQALVQAAQRPRVGPLLRLTSDDPAANLAQALAAIAAMS